MYTSIYTCAQVTSGTTCSSSVKLALVCEYLPDFTAVKTVFLIVAAVVVKTDSLCHTYTGMHARTHAHTHWYQAHMSHTSANLSDGHLCCCSSSLGSSCENSPVPYTAEGWQNTACHWHITKIKGGICVSMNAQLSLGYLQITSADEDDGDMVQLLSLSCMLCLSSASQPPQTHA